MKKNCLLFFFSSFLILLPTFFTPIIRANDLNGDILEIIYSKQILLKDFSLPLWTPYINQGIPTQADPLNAFFNPLVFITFMIFSPDMAVKIICFISLFLAQLFMYLLLEKLAINRKIAIFLTLTYGTSSYFAARIVAGHLEKILTYPLLPLFMLVILFLDKKPTIRNIGVLSIILSLMLLSGELYNLLYAFCFLVFLIFYYLFKRKTKSVISICISFFLFFLFSAIKIFPYVQLQSYIIKDINPFNGSQNVISILYYLFIPIKQLFLSLNLKDFLITGFNWWETSAFIGFFPLIYLLIGIKFYKKIHNKTYINLFLWFLLISVLIAIPAVLINPFHFLILSIKQLQLFHAPSRIFAFGTMFILALVGIVITTIINTSKNHQIIKRIIYISLILNVICTYVLFQTILFKKNFPPINQNYDLLLNHIATSYPNWYIADFLSEGFVDQVKILHTHQFLLASNYGLQLTNSPAVDFIKYDFLPENSFSYRDILPRYIITTKNSKKIHGFPAKLIETKGNAALYEIKQYTPFASILASGDKKSNSKLLSLKVNGDIIRIIAQGNKNGKLRVLQSNYPGWNVLIDGQKSLLPQGRFLEVTLLPGKHTYEFVFSSPLFFLGTTISISSYIIYILFLISSFNFFIKAKKDSTQHTKIKN